MPKCRNGWYEHVKPLLENLNPELQHCFGEDFGRTGDLTSIAPLQIGQDLIRRCPFLVELRNVPFKNQEQVLFYIVDRLPRFSGGKMDARVVMASISRNRRATVTASGLIEEVMLSQSWYLENMAPFKGRL